MTFEAMETALVAAAYQALGQSVTYTTTGATGAAIYAIIDNGAEQIGFGAQTSEEIARARVKVSDVATPKRGDTIEMANGTIYIVDAVDIEQNIEWLLTMTEDAR